MVLKHCRFNCIVSTEWVLQRTITSHVFIDKRDPKSAPAEGAEMDSRAKFGKETIAGAQRRPKWFHIMMRRLTQGVLRILRLAQACSTSAQVCSPLALVKIVVAYVRRLPQNQRKGKLILSI